jgi:hypothetical protein
MSALSDTQPSVRLKAAEHLPADEETTRAVVARLDSTDANVQQGVTAYFVARRHGGQILLIPDAYSRLSESGRKSAIAMLNQIATGRAYGISRSGGLSDGPYPEQTAREALEKIGLQSSDARADSN